MELIVLSQEGCNPCIAVKNLLASEEVDHQLIDVHENPEVAAKYGVMSTPVILLVDEKGEVVERSRGFNPAELENMISKL
ncbi:thioredoxin family protein [Bacillus infantis]|uniref:thioredoxin family protein n=1 Tax=Bacillus infantis TaxID=324767 RepID=UPI003CEF4A18